MRLHTSTFWIDPDDDVVIQTMTSGSVAVVTGDGWGGGDVWLVFEDTAALDSWRGRVDRQLAALGVQQVLTPGGDAA